MKRWLQTPRSLIAFLPLPLVVGIYFSMPEPAPLPTVDFVDLNRFAGDWYVIANIPTFVERGTKNGIERYEVRDDGDIDIIFTFNSIASGKSKRLTARGFVTNRETNAEWRVQFFWPIRFPYYVIDLAPDYSYTVVGVPGRSYVWIMARQPTLDDAVYVRIVGDLDRLGFDIGKLERQHHDILADS